ncbi:hypothetical protein [Cupriavidus necator]
MKFNHFAMSLAASVAIGAALVSGPIYAAGLDLHRDGAKSTFNPYADGARGKFDPYADGARARFNPYADGARGKFNTFTDGLRASRFDVFTDGGRD